MDGRRGARSDDRDRFGFDENRDWLRESLGKLVPAAVARRAVAASVRADRESLRPGGRVELTIEFRNRLPVPASVVTPRQRRWGWTVDGELAASDERVLERDSPGELVFRVGERKRVTRTWSGRFERTDGRREWVDADPGEYEITAFVATERREPSDSVTVRVEP